MKSSTKQGRDAKGRFTHKPEPRKSLLGSSVFTLGDKVRLGIAVSSVLLSILGFAWRLDTRLVVVETKIDSLLPSHAKQQVAAMKTPELPPTFDPDSQPLKEITLGTPLGIPDILAQGDRQRWNIAPVTSSPATAVTQPPE